ncbi:hypothetical protein [Emticicia sp. SJ17W-69]|uniref:hypothetical protein n=1 Tax=Emticicia sp. SJ17W-69 TaxID=3421657 RepID=UPI003EBF3375
MKKQLMLWMILSTIFAMSCEKDSQVLGNETSMKNYVVNYGTSFGMCIGPCRKEMNLVKNDLVFTVYTTEGRGAVGGVPQSYKEKLTNLYASNIIQNIDFEAFKKLPEVIGCPDCADGGAEWIEIIKDDSKHKVTFEFGTSPKEIEKLVQLLREKRTYFEEKYVK